MLTWEKPPAGIGYRGHMAYGLFGKWRVFQIEYDSISGSRDPNGPIILFCDLPGIKDRIGNFPSENDAKNKAEAVLEYWLQKTPIWETIAAGGARRSASMSSSK